MTVDEIVNMLCQFPGDTPVVIVPDYEAGGRQMQRTRNVLVLNDKDKQPAFVAITTDGVAPRPQT